MSNGRNHHGLAVMRTITAGARRQEERGETNNYGRLLPPNVGAPIDAPSLRALAETMRPMGPETLDPSMPAGMTFLGQFVDHDITLDTTSELGVRVNPDTVPNLRTPRLELDSVYGQGPGADAWLYDSQTELDGLFIIGNDRTIVHPVAGEIPPNPLDFQRNAQGTAMIGDPRNDENTLIAQLHLNFMLFHNAVRRKVAAGELEAERRQVKGPSGALAPEGDFALAQRMVRWHYQWIVNHSYLPAVVQPQVLQRAVQRVKAGDARVGSVDFSRASMPVEFAAAAFRFAHSQVRSRYRINDALELNLFQNTPEEPGLGSFRPVKPSEVVDFRHLFSMGGSTPQAATQLDTEMATELYKLPFAADVPSLAERNLLRGEHTFRLPSGEVVAARMGVRPIRRHAKLADMGIPVGQTPLWFYVLAEAELGGGKLGDVGGSLVAMVLLRMQRLDPDAYLGAQPGWTPALGGGSFDIGALLTLAEAESQRHR